MTHLAALAVLTQSRVHEESFYKWPISKANHVLLSQSLDDGFP